MANAQRLLVIDDEPAVLKLVQSLLQKAGYAVTPAASGKEGLKLLEEQTFDCVVTDAVMPVMTGYELVRAIRANRQHADIPVLMLTRKRNREDVQIAVEAGVSDYVLKPIDERLLLEKVELCLKKVGGRRQLTELAPIGDDARATALVPCHVRAVGESGLTLLVPFSINGDHRCQIQASVFAQIGIDMPLMKLMSCQPTVSEYPALPFEAKYAFVSISEADVAKIRAWIQREATRRRS